ncbi:hypothetical protein LX32DRAFT_646938 [Colletotrichum zoysiae]|uniref:NACHT domain-containing protein n=1 Tax=Colletotrichum zoysiae TaxID=1216348 RepID=A0AAD9LWH5_9PEZI|nr:hypothetical protein LX32DRAFT_646938 [Colletotrichum zoysiae]
MADPWTIVGSASAILTFVEFAGKCVKTAKNLHQTGKTEDNTRIENIMTEMQGLIDRVKSEKAGTPTSDVDAGLFAIANECEDLGRAILKLLSKASKGEGSLRETIRASVSAVWNEKEVEDLQNQLQRCTTQLNTQMLTLMRSETGHKLEQILAMQSSHSRQVESLRDLTTKLSINQEGALDNLSSLLRLLGATDTILEQINQRRILDALRVPEMKQRYDQVSDAAQGTFDWVMKSSEIPDHPELLVPLSTWLSEGKGIFHISGKPGSGKSTLMELIAESKDTKTLLNLWAGKDKLVKAGVFIWKYGHPIQRTFNGVVRSLLFNILTQLPDLLPKVLRKYWEPHRHSPWLPMPDFHIASKDVRQAFEQCIDSKGSARHTRIFLMLDGLDELNDPDELHTNFVLQLMKWSKSNPKKLKICVASREENAFMNNFPPQQRLRLHLITKQDIEQMVTTRLNGHPHFWAFSESDRDHFCSEIAKQSSGVFLWVKLVLNDVYENLDQRRSLKALKTALKQVPEELEDLFFKMLSSVRKADRKEAYCLFQLSSQFLFAPALVFSFLEDILALSMDDHQTDDHSTEVEDLKIRHDKLEARLRGLSRGLLEITESNSTGFEVLNLTFESRVRPVHRTFNDWLLNSMPEMFDEFRSSVDKEVIILRCLVRHAKVVQWGKFSREEWEFLASRLIFSMLTSPRSRSKESIHMARLGELGNALHEKYRENGVSFELEADTKDPYRPNILHDFILYQSFELRFAPFIDWGLRNITWAQETQIRIQLFRWICGKPHMYSRPRGYHSRLEWCIGVFIGLGVDPNSQCCLQQKETTPWVAFLLSMMKYFTNSVHPHIRLAMRKLLEADADPRMFLAWRARKRRSITCKVEVIWDPNYRSHTNANDSEFSERHIQQGVPSWELETNEWSILETVKSLEQISDWALVEESEDDVSIQMTLWEFVRVCLPDDADTLLPLIDRNLARRTPNQHTAVEEDTVAVQLERHRVEGQDPGGGKETDAKTDAADELARNKTQVGVLDSRELVLIFMVLGVCLGVLFAKLLSRT